MTQLYDASQTASLSIAAAAAWIPELSLEQRTRANHSITSNKRFDWHFVPTARHGVTLGEMSRSQINEAMNLMASSLSDGGYRKARSIIDHETILGRIEADAGVGRFDRNIGLYYFSVFGKPGTEEPWGWRVEGHHLSLNFTVVDGKAVSPTPSFFGANPALVPSGPKKGLRILKEEEDMARELLLSLDPRQQEQATLYPVAPSEMITRNSTRVDIGDPIGLPASKMVEDQMNKLLALIGVYLGRKPADVAARAMEKLQSEGLDAIRFGWAGSHHVGQPHYYRIHGPTLFVEYDNTQDMGNHIHSVWRDVDGDFGRDLLSEHYRLHHT